MTAPKSHSPVSGPVTSGYVGVVYFHGMGEQRRMEELTRLTSAIDTYLYRSKTIRDDPKGYLTKPKVRTEPARVPSREGEVVHYITTRHLADNVGWDGDTRQARFYEAYWAPHMAGGLDPIGVLKWIGRQLWRPIPMMWTPWRERQRLRRAALAEISADRSIWPQGTLPEDFETLQHLYLAFGDHDEEREKQPSLTKLTKTAQARAGGSAGSFEAFVHHIQQAADNDSSDDPDKGKRLETLARNWWWHYAMSELRNLGVMVLAVLAMMILALSALGLVLQALSAFGPDTALRQWLGEDWESPSWRFTGGYLLSAAMALGFGRFLGRFMGDVQAWASLSETSSLNAKRAAILAEGMDTLQHVLDDPQCHRVIVIGHSLGTSVAHDCLLALTHKNRGHNDINHGDPMNGPIRLDKLRHFVTIASPIDKINYFFESYRSKTRGYPATYEALRGDIGSAPFTRNGKPYIHWVNYWDRADVISGSLQSPTAATSLTNVVDNVHVSNLRFPSPGAAHSAYFQNRTVIDQVFQMIFFGNWNYDGKTLPLNPNGKGLNYDSVRLGPGHGLRNGLSHHITAAALTVGCAALIGHSYVGFTGLLVIIVGTVTLAALAISASVLRLRIRRRNREPL